MIIFWYSHDYLLFNIVSKTSHDYFCTFTTTCLEQVEDQRRLGEVEHFEHLERLVQPLGRRALEQAHDVDRMRVRQLDREGLQ